MYSGRRIERQQLPYHLKLFNSHTERLMGYLGNVSEEGFMLISELPLIVGADFSVELRIPGRDAGGDNCMVPIRLDATCQWCREDANPRHYDSGFKVLEGSPEYGQLVKSLRDYFSFSPLNTPA